MNERNACIVAAAICGVIAAYILAGAGIALGLGHLSVSADWAMAILCLMALKFMVFAGYCYVQAQRQPAKTVVRHIRTH